MKNYLFIMKKCLLRAAVAAPIFAGGIAFAGEADVVAVKFDCTAERLCSFNVTVRHADSGWRHYADNWQVLDGDGTVLAVRRLAHPHVNEQPFTRSLSGVMLPPGVNEVRIRAHDSLHGNGGLEVVVDLTADPDEDSEIKY